MLRKPLYIVLLIAAGLLLPAQAARAQAQEPKATRLPITVKDADASLDNDWFGLYMQGKKIGYMYSGRAKVTENGVTIYREKLRMTMKLQSAGQKTELLVEQTMDFEGAAPFKLLRGDYLSKNEQITEHITLTAKDKGYVAFITVGGNNQTKTVELDFTLADSMSSELWLKSQPKIGDKITTSDLDMEDLKIYLVTAELTATKVSVVNGVKVKFHEVKSLSHKNNVASESRYDEKGQLLSGTIAGLLEMRRESEEDAKNTEFSSDLFVLGMAKLDKGIGDPERLNGLILEYESKDGPIFPDFSRQTVVDKGKGVYQIRLGKDNGKKVKATEKEIKDGQAETLAYPIKDAKVLELAKQAAADAKTDLDKAKNICKFVKDFIQPKLAAAAPKMHDLMVRKEGDCKSYALMFTCLARAAGLTSREVSGFVYMGDGILAFGGHAWNEVLLDGYWVPVDASMNQVDADAQHICLGTDNESSSNLLKTFGKLNFKVIEVQR